MRSYTLLFVAFVALAGCAAGQTPKTAVASANDAQDQGSAYAAALAEAFDSYEGEVRTAAALSYSSEAEAVAVMRTFSSKRLDYELKQALARRNLTISGFAVYAQEHADFFHAQQRLHWGRMEQIQLTVDSIALRVQANDEQVAQLSANVGE